MLPLVAAFALGVLSQVTVIVRDVPYASGVERTMDLYLPAARGWPTIIFVHGGSLTSGDKRDSNVPAICENFARSGIGCASVNYRLGPATKWPAQPEDVAAAVAWVRHNIGAHGGDSTSLVLFGHSSGCTLSAIVATDPRYLATQALTTGALRGVVPMGCLLEPVLPAVRDSTKLRSFFGGSGGLGTYPTVEAFLDANPTRYVGAHVPPTLVLIAEGEQLQPPILEHARAFEARMNAVGRPVEIVILPDRRHLTALSKMAEPNDPTLRRVIEFVRRVATSSLREAQGGA